MDGPSQLFILNGNEPAVVGKKLSAFMVEHFYENGQITNTVNIAYLQFEGAWYRLYFECGTVFWRASEQPGIPENSGLEHGLLLNDLSAMVTVVQKKLESIEYSGSESGDLEVTLRFESGNQLCFSYSAAADAAQLTV